jgi:DNA-binding NarL/FixJ family response regulator
MRKARTRLPEQGTQTPSPAPDLIPAETRNQPRTHMAIGTANGGTSDALSMNRSVRLINSCGEVVLTPREEQTVNLVTEGLNNREIATELNVKENTVKKSLLRIYDKIGVSNRVELVLYALSHSQQRSSEPLQQEEQAA